MHTQSIFTSAIPCLLDEADLDIASIVHEDVQCTVDTDGFFDLCVEFRLGSSDVKIKDRRAGIFGTLKALSRISTGGYDSITTCNDSMDEVLSDSRSAACHEPSKLGHDGGEFKNEEEIVKGNFVGSGCG